MKTIALETFIKQAKDEIDSASVVYNNIELFIFTKEKMQVIELMDKQKKPKDKQCMVK